jgi:molecular chaperone DnaK
LKEALKGNDVEAIKSKTGSLTEASMKLGEAIYKTQQEQKPEEQQPEENADGKKEDVVDADFEEVKDKKEEK